MTAVQKERLRVEMVSATRQAIGRGYVPEFYEQVAQGFCEIAEAMVQEVEAEARKRKRKKVRNEP